MGVQVLPRIDVAPVFKVEGISQTGALLRDWGKVRKRCPHVMTVRAKENGKISEDFCHCLVSNARTHIFGTVCLKPDQSLTNRSHCVTSIC